jgi:hypothetical protein
VGSVSQGLTYLDAVKLLGGSGPLMKAADNLLGAVLRDVLPGLAAARYEEAARRLAVEVPEFAFWLSELEFRAVSRGLEDALVRAASGGDPGPAARRAGSRLPGGARRAGPGR